MKKTNYLEKIRNKFQTFAAATAILLACATAAHANINVTPPSINFGSQSVGSAGASQTVTVTNENKRSVKIVTASNSVGQFSFSGPSLPVLLTTGQSYTATVTFNPSAAQAYSGVLVLTRANGQTISIPLSGTGGAPTPTPTPKPPPLVAPTISSQPVSAKITVGQTATFNVAATGTAPMTYQWKKGGAIIGGAISSTYTTPAATTADNNATFTAVVSNAAGSATSNAATLTVSTTTVAPTITTQPASQTIGSGKTATFSVVATGTAPLMYQWSKGGVAISGATSASYTTPTETAGAQFTVTVANSAGTVTSNPATLTVSASTLILNSSASSLNFGSVSVSANSTQSVTLTNAGNSNIMISNVTVSGAGFNAGGVSSGLILTPGQTAILTATFAPASAGSAKGSISVASNATNSPDSITLSGTGVAAVAHSVTLSWSPSVSVVTGYNTYSSQTSGGPYTKLTNTPVATTSYIDSNVQAGKTYYFVVTSVDAGNLESVFSKEVSALVP